MWQIYLTARIRQIPIYICTTDHNALIAEPFWTLFSCEAYSYVNNALQRNFYGIVVPLVERHRENYRACQVSVLLLYRATVDKRQGEQEHRGSVFKRFQKPDAGGRRTLRRAIATRGSITKSQMVPRPRGEAAGIARRLTYPVTNSPPIINGTAVYTETIIPC